MLEDEEAADQSSFINRSNSKLATNAAGGGAGLPQDLEQLDAVLEQLAIEI